MKKRIRLSIVVMLSIFSIGSSIYCSHSNSIVKAAEVEEIADVKLTKKVPYIVVHPGETVEEISSRRITDVISNYGHVTGNYTITVYPTLDNGDIDYGHPLDNYNYRDKIKNRESYKAIINFDVTNLKGHRYNKHIYDIFSGDWYVDKAYNNESQQVSFVIPLKVESKTSKKVTTKVNLIGVVRGAKNKKVKTYTSTGKVSKKNVYGRRSYKLNQKKKLKGKVYYKIYGKNYWILGSNISIKN